MVFALGFFTSARIAEQVRAGIQALPRGQRYAGLAMGFTLPQTYRYVLLPMAFRIIIPPLTSESMNIIKNSSVAFAVSIAELTMLRACRRRRKPRAASRSTWPSRLLYFVSAFADQPLMRASSRSGSQVPGLIGGQVSEGGHECSTSASSTGTSSRASSSRAASSRSS